MRLVHVDECSTLQTPAQDDTTAADAHHQDTDPQLRVIDANPVTTRLTAGSSAKQRINTWPMRRRLRKRLRKKTRKTPRQLIIDLLKDI